MKRKTGIIISSALLVVLIIIALTSPFTFFRDSNNRTQYPELERVQFDVANRTIDDFAYLLQNINMDEIHNSKYDLMIIDYSINGTEAGEFSSSNVTYMKSSGAAQKLLLSYLSIGEAEDYRFYWNSTWETNPPNWLDEENPEWEGNYKVNYWDHEWQNIIFQYLDKIINASFDGVYMDIIDAYEYYEGNISHANWLMMDFVANISNYVKSNAGNDFIVFAQNADNLLVNTSYVDNIDGIGREDLFYNGNTLTNSSWQEEGINNLNITLGLDKVILIIDYPDNWDKIHDFYVKCGDNNFLGYAGTRNLDELQQYNFYPPT